MEGGCWGKILLHKGSTGEHFCVFPSAKTDDPFQCFSPANLFCLCRVFQLLSKCILGKLSSYISANFKVNKHGEIKYVIAFSVTVTFQSLELKLNYIAIMAFFVSVQLVQKLNNIFPKSNLNLNFFFSYFNWYKCI